MAKNMQRTHTGIIRTNESALKPNYWMTTDKNQPRISSPVKKAEIRKESENNGHHALNNKGRNVRGKNFLKIPYTVNVCVLFYTITKFVPYLTFYNQTVRYKYRCLACKFYLLPVNDFFLLLWNFDGTKQTTLLQVGRLT